LGGEVLKGVGGAVERPGDSDDQGTQNGVGLSLFAEDAQYVTATGERLLRKGIDREKPSANL